MAHLIDKDALVAEIKKRIKETESMQPKFDQFWAGQISAFKGVLKILDTLEVKDLQKEPVSEDLKEFEVEYIEREKDNIVCAYDRHAGLVDGAKWQKQQMMKDAIEAEIINWASMFTSIKVIEPERAETMIKEKFDIGDKVKLIIVKEE